MRRVDLAKSLHLLTLGGGVLVLFAVSFSFVPSAGGRVAIFGLSVVVGLGMFHTRDDGHLATLRWEDPLLALAGTLATMVILRDLHWSSVAAASAVGLLGALVTRVVAGARDYHGAVIYGGAFIGATSPLVFRSSGWLVGAALLFGVAWSVSRDAWVGVGGKIGSIAALSTVSVRLVASWLHQAGPGVRVHDVPSFSRGLALALIGVMGALATWWLSVRRRGGAVMGSSLSSLGLCAVVWSAPGLFGPHADLVEFAWFAASFAGMTNPSRLRHTAIDLTGCGVLIGLLSLALGPEIAGVGGSGGLTALPCVFALRGIEHEIQRFATRRVRGDSTDIARPKRGGGTSPRA